MIYKFLITSLTVNNLFTILYNLFIIIKYKKNKKKHINK